MRGGGYYGESYGVAGGGGEGRIRRLRVQDLRCRGRPQVLNYLKLPESEASVLQDLEETLAYKYRCRNADNL